jgi:hypothetical protein
MSLLALALLAAQAMAPGDQVTFDIHCRIAAQAAHEQADGAMKAATLLSTMFYFGRVDSALPEAEMEQRLATESARIEGQPLGPLLEKCGAFMQQRGQQLEAIGARLTSPARGAEIH